MISSLEVLFSLYFWIKKVYFVMSRSFAKPALSRTVTRKAKQSTTSTQNTFTFQNYLSKVGLKNKTSSAQFGGLLLLLLHLPRPWAPPADCSPSLRNKPFQSSEGDNPTAAAHMGGLVEFAPSPIGTQGLCRRREGQGHLHAGKWWRRRNGDEEDVDVVENVVEKDDHDWLLGWWDQPTIRWA